VRDQTVLAYAKVNLTLDILRRRPDGYHDLEMVMQSISLHDVVTVRTETGSGEIVVHAGREDLPSGPENIAWKAADAFFSATGLRNDGVEITIEKNIPAAAGMAGGSADGAAVLRALRGILCPEMPDAELEEIGARVGSDVPFCIHGGTALAEDRGERLTDLPPMPACIMVICKPEFGLSTPKLFGRVRVDALKQRPNHDAMRAALAAGSLSGVADSLCNVFCEVLTEEESREITHIRQVMLENGALNAVMTGSGPTVFGLFDKEPAAQLTADVLRKKYAQVFLAEPVNHE